MIGRFSNDFLDLSQFWLLSDASLSIQKSALLQSAGFEGLVVHAFLIDQEMHQIVCIILADFYFLKQELQFLNAAQLGLKIRWNF